MRAASFDVPCFYVVCTCGNQRARVPCKRIDEHLARVCSSGCTVMAKATRSMYHPAAGNSFATSSMNSSGERSRPRLSQRRKSDKDP